MERPLTRNIRPGRDPLDLHEYERAGGYQSVQKALKTLTPREVVEIIKKSTLKGRGGAGFPTGQKWSLVPPPSEASRPRYLIANADEMEPGTFKDRLLMEGDPHQLIEGMILSAYAVEADKAIIFLRWAYTRPAALLDKAIQEAHRAGYLGQNILGSGFSLDIHLHISAGRYICGEETALLNALEGKRPIPRAKPPYPLVSGLFGRPTVVNNVETLCCIPHIVNRGPEWFLGLSRTDEGGTKLYGVSGRVKHPGAWELPMGTKVREIIEEHGGGMRDGLRLRAVLPGGGSTDFQAEEQLDVELDFSHEIRSGSRLGTGMIIVLDDHTCPVGFVLNLEHFFAVQSCGWCTPCREGLPWIEKTLSALETGWGRPEDLEVLEDHVHDLGPGHTFCAHAPGAMEPLASALKLFRKDFERHIETGSCPWK